MGEQTDNEPRLRHTIHFTGCDRTGKSTTRKTFATITKEKHVCYDRSFVDNLVYDEMFRGITYSNSFIEDYMNRHLKGGNVHIVYMDLDSNEINRRYKETEGGTYDLKELEAVKALFSKYLKIASSYGIDVIYIDCNGKTVNDIVGEVVYKIEGGR